MPDTAQSIPLFGFGFGHKSPNVSAQTRKNMYAELYDDPDKTRLALFARPGLERFANTTGALTPMRCAVASDIVLGGHTLVMFVQGDHLIGIDGTGATAESSTNTLSTSTGIAHSLLLGTQGLIVDGVSGYVFDTAVSGFNLTDLATVPGAASFPFTTPSITAIASRGVAVDPSELGRFRWSNAGDLLTWDALDFATAESSSDPLTAVFEMAGELLLIGTQTIEFWAPSAAGAAGQLPFVRVGGANIQWGTKAVNTICKCNDAVVFLGRNQAGNLQVVSLKGYTGTVVSTPDIEGVIAQQATPESAEACFSVLSGHPFYILNFGETTLVFDLLTKNWDVWETEGSRFSGQFIIPAFGNIMASDYRDSRLYLFDGRVATDDGEIMVREVVSKHAFANLARISMKEVRIDCQTGVGVISGQGSNPQIMMQWSKDGGHTWGSEVWQTLGPIGAYLTTPTWRMLGIARDWVFKLRVTDPVPLVIIGAAAIVAP